MRIQFLGLIGVALASIALPASAQAPSLPRASAPTADGHSTAEMRELLEAARATAKASRESVDHGRVVPDILQQILAKLDKIENKLDKVENAIKAQARNRR